MPDSNSIEASTPVYLIHKIVNNRYFWAYWPSFRHFKADLFPSEYRVTEQQPDQIRQDLTEHTPEAQELNCTEVFKTQLYRRIKRAELPGEVQAKIRHALAQQRSDMHHEWLQVGFRAEDLSSLKALKQRYRHLLYQYHPDHGGNATDFLHLQEVYQQAYFYLRCRQK